MDNEQRLLKALKDLVAQIQYVLPIPEQVDMSELERAQTLLEELT